MDRRPPILPVNYQPQGLEALQVPLHRSHRHTCDIADGFTVSKPPRNAQDHTALGLVVRKPQVTHTFFTQTNSLFHSLFTAFFRANAELALACGATFWYRTDRRQSCNLNLE